MTKTARITYHRDLWPAAARTQGIDPRDADLRRAVALQCMAEVAGPAITTSDPKWGSDETTALFTYLRFLAAQDLDTQLAWERCRRDYRAFNRARQADHWERKAYGQRGSTRLQRQRFGGRRTAAGDPLSDTAPDLKTASDRLMTMRARARSKQGSANPF